MESHDGRQPTFQGNLAEGGTTWIDDGKPLPGLSRRRCGTCGDLADHLRQRACGLCDARHGAREGQVAGQKFFKNLNSLAYGGATLSSDLYERMERLAVQHTGYRLPFVTGWGSTETAPTATSVHWASERVGLVGLPYPGVQLKMVPTGEEGRYELRLKSVIVTPGYHKRPDLTAQMFDDEGFYQIGDAGRFVDPSDPSQGLVFDGRVVEDFKLTSGTFVLVGTLRTTAVAAVSPVLQDAVVCGQDRDHIGLLGSPNVAACRRVAGARTAKAARPRRRATPAAGRDIGEAQQADIVAVLAADHRVLQHRRGRGDRRRAQGADQHEGAAR